MPTSILPAQDQSSLARAAAALHRGGIVALATDTVYGIGASFDSRTGIERIYALKGRSHEKAIPLLIAEPSQVAMLASAVTGEAQMLIEAFWPGAMTLVLARHHTLLSEIAPGQQTVGVRCPNHRGVRALLDLLGKPIACTSANLSGSLAALTALEVAETFRDGLELILDGGPSSSVLPSTVVDVSVAGQPRIVREGAIAREQISHVLGRAL